MNKIIKIKIFKALKSLILIFPLSLIFYFFSSNFISQENLLETFLKLYKQVILGIILITFGYFLRYLRWRIILNNFNLRTNINVESKLWFASYAFTATPGKVGELIRCFFLKKVFDISLKSSLISIITERFLDLLSVIIIAFTFVFFNYKKFFYFDFIYLFFFLILFCFTFAKFISNYLKKRKKSIFDFKWKIFKKSITFKDLYDDNLIKLLRIKVFSKLIFLSVASWGLEGLAFYTILKESNINISYLNATFIHTSSGLLGAISLLPGGLGFTEVLTIYLLEINTIPVSIGVPLTAIIRLITLWYISFLGIISLFIIRKRIFNDFGN